MGIHTNGLAVINLVIGICVCRVDIYYMHQLTSLFRFLDGCAVADPDLYRRGCKSQAWPVNAVS